MNPLGNTPFLKPMFFCLFLILLSLSASASGLENSTPADQNLYFTHWEGNFLSWHRQGIACWVHDARGNLRFEIMVGGQGPFPRNLQRILAWQGAEGWTVISVESGGGTFSRWYEEWQEMPPSLDVWLRVVASQSSVGLQLPALVRDTSPGGRPLLLPYFANDGKRPRVKRLEMPLLSSHSAASANAKVGFRHNLTHRGRGRGGYETVLNLIQTTSEDTGIRITSSHQPGSLEVAAPRPVAAEFNPDEVFLPWWPLSEIIRLKN